MEMQGVCWRKCAEVISARFLQSEFSVPKLVSCLRGYPGLFSSVETESEVRVRML